MNAAPPAMPPTADYGYCRDLPPVVPAGNISRGKLLDLLLVDAFVPVVESDQRLRLDLAWLIRAGWQISISGIGLDSNGNVASQARLLWVPDWVRLHARRCRGLSLKEAA